MSAVGKLLDGQLKKPTNAVVGKNVFECCWRGFVAPESKESQVLERLRYMCGAECEQRFAEWQLVYEGPQVRPCLAEGITILRRQECIFEIRTHFFLL